MKAKLGRPKLDVTRAVLIGARFTPEEAQLIDEAVARAGSVKSDWMRAILLEAAGLKERSPVAAPPPRVVQETLGEFLD